MRTFQSATYEVRLHLKTEIGVVVANDHAFLSDTDIGMEQEKIQEPTEVEIKIASITEAITSGDIPHLYANGFSLVHTDADSALIFMRMGVPVAVVHLSNTILKEIAQKSAKSIEDLEASLGMPIPDMSMMKDARRALAAKRKSEQDDSGSHDSSESAGDGHSA